MFIPRQARFCSPDLRRWDTRHYKTTVILSGAVFQAQCHPERSRSSGVAKDLPLIRPNALAKLPLPSTVIKLTTASDRPSIIAEGNISSYSFTFSAIGQPNLKFPLIRALGRVIGFMTRPGNKLSNKGLSCRRPVLHLCLSARAWRETL